MDVCQNKIRVLRKSIRGWASNVVAEMNRHKSMITEEFNKLDLEAETRILSDDEKSRTKELYVEINRYCTSEEIKIRQRSRDRCILESDRNTTYFQAVANQRSRKKEVKCLMGPTGLVYDKKGILNIAVEFSKTLFAKEDRGEVNLGDIFWVDNDKVTLSLKSKLRRLYSIVI